jgi:hypothetical protein
MVFNYQTKIAKKQKLPEKGNCQKVETAKKRKLLKSENSTRMPQEDIANKMCIVQIYHPTQYLHISMAFKNKHEMIKQGLRH